MEEDEDRILLNSLGVESANAECIERDVLAEVPGSGSDSLAFCFLSSFKLTVVSTKPACNAAVSFKVVYLNFERLPGKNRFS